MLVGAFSATWISNWCKASLNSNWATKWAIKTVTKALKSSVIKMSVQSDELDLYIERKRLKWMKVLSVGHLQSWMEVMLKHNSGGLLPTVVITGPRRGSGKTTLVERCLQDEKGIVRIDISPTT